MSQEGLEDSKLPLSASGVNITIMLVTILKIFDDEFKTTSTVYWEAFTDVTSFYELYTMSLFYFGKMWMQASIPFLSQYIITWCKYFPSIYIYKNIFCLSITSIPLQRKSKYTEFGSLIDELKVSVTNILQHGVNSKESLLNALKANGFTV